MSPLYRKIAWRLVPFLMLLYMVAFLDRVNISFAALTMNRDLGISESVYGFAAGVFFLSYCLFEVPANLVLARHGRAPLARHPHGHLGSRLDGHGICSHRGVVHRRARFFSASRSPVSIPASSYYFTFWLPRAMRTRILALFLLAVPLCNSIGSPISAHILLLNNVAGLQRLAVALSAGGRAGRHSRHCRLVAARRRARGLRRGFLRRERTDHAAICSEDEVLQLDPADKVAARCARLRHLLPLEQRQITVSPSGCPRSSRVLVHPTVSTGWWAIRNLRLRRARDAVGQPPPSRVSCVALSVFRFAIGIHRCRPGSLWL